jgi:serine/threonine protein kinase
MKLDTVLADRYQILELLTENVELKFLAQDLQTQNRVFIRILRFEDFEENELKLFEQEARTLQNLSHPAIPGYVDYFDVETAIPGCLDYRGVQIADIRGVALVQTYIEAPSLEDIVVDGGKFSETEVIELADRLLSILIYLHEQNPPVIHCGLNPRSILMTNRSGNSIGDVYLVDFGKVRLRAGSFKCSRLPSYKERYLPLYHLFYHRPAIPGLDLYGLGMTIIYLLTGDEPDNFLDLSDRKLKSPPEFEVSENLHSWLRKMIQPNPFQPDDESKGFALARSAQTELRSFNFRTSNLIEIGKRVFDNIFSSFPR